MIRTYRELLRLPTFEDRFYYLRLVGNVGEITFGFDRYLNQALYRSSKWKSVRDEVIIRDDGYDLGVREDGREITDAIYVHHMNPIILDDFDDCDDFPEYVFDPKFLISTSLNTHNMIHYGGRPPEAFAPIERYPGDTLLW